MTIPNSNNDTQIQMPAHCPHCGLGIVPKFLSGAAIPNTNKYCAIFCCPSCSDAIFAEYEIRAGFDDIPFSILKRILPNCAPHLDIPADIQKFFPDFFDMYKQSALAEACGLQDLCGMGYRRALEFLVKEHLVNIYPDEKDTISKERLSDSIKRLVAYPKLNALAKAASWIGNDYVHLVKKHPDRDVTDMKAFTCALCHLILADKRADEAMSMIESGTAPK